MVSGKKILVLASLTGLLLTFLISCSNSSEDIAFRKAICAIVGLNQNEISVAGKDGASFSSSDGGLSFTSENSNTTEDITDSRLNGTTIWSVGVKGYIGSKLSLHADYTLIDSGTTENLNSLRWLTPTVGLAAGDNGTIAQTEDAGATWSSRTIGTNGTTNLHSIDCSDQNDCWIAGSGGVAYWTGDLGRTFMHIDVDTANKTDLYGVSTPTIGEAWMVGDVGRIFRTTDIGKSFQPVESGTTNTLRDIYINTEGKGLVVGDEFVGQFSNGVLDPLTSLFLFVGVEMKRIVPAIDRSGFLLGGTDGTLYETPDFGTTLVRIPIITSTGGPGDTFGDTNDSFGDTGDTFGDTDDSFGDTGDSGDIIDSNPDTDSEGELALFTISQQDFSFSHSVGTTSCPQKIGEFVVTNTGQVSLAMAIEGQGGAPLTADPSGAFTLAAGQSRTITLFFDCSQTSSFTAELEISGVSQKGAETSSKVTVDGTVDGTVK